METPKAACVVCSKELAQPDRRTKCTACSTPEPTKTHCKVGHELAVVGWYGYRTRGGTWAYTCKLCRQEYAAAKKAKRGKAKKRPRRTQEQVRENDASAEAIRVNRVLELEDRLWQAATSWEREDIRRQLDAVAKELKE